MTNYNCPRCGYNTLKKIHFKRHAERQKLCKVNEHGKDINIHDYYKLLSNPIDPIEILELYDEIKKAKKIEMEKDEKIKNLEKELEKLKELNTTITNNGSAVGDYNTNTIHNNNMTINISINSHKDPNTTYILAKHCDAALKNGNLVEGCIQIARLVWFNGNHPENHSIFKTNKKDGSMKCLENGDVKEYNLSSKFKEIVDIILTVFERTEQESDKFYDLNDIFDNPHLDPKFFKQLEQDLAKELYNHKELVKETIDKLKIGDPIIKEKIKKGNLDKYKASRGEI